MKVLLIDNYDSFTHILRDYIVQTGANCDLYRNDERILLSLLPENYDALVISPGPETPVKAGLLMQVLPTWLEALPVLGVCLGHQAIGEYYGAKLVQAKRPRHGKVDEMNHLGGLLFKGVPKIFKATRYHSLILQHLPDSLIGNCWSKDELMALEHKTLPIYGLQFHPESCETEFGLTMIKNFLDLVKKDRRF
ncbi:MAG: aminodeoxychorismate/anthranilate synthase component II [Bacteroidota bacterium]|nr:aminodeoxychorismate/anthranilate synthase component II [Bacteroidota bacterium]